MRDIKFDDLKIKLNLSIYKYNFRNNFQCEFHNRRFEINKLRIEFEIKFDIIYID